MHDHQLAEDLALVRYGMRGYVQGAVGPLQQTRMVRRVRTRALQRIRETPRYVNELARPIAIAQRIDALVLNDALEEAHDLFRRVRFAHQCGKRLLRSAGNQLGADLEVAFEPVQGQPVHERNDRVRNGGERYGERKDESQGDSHTWLLLSRRSGARLRRALSRDLSVRIPAFEPKVSPEWRACGATFATFTYHGKAVMTARGGTSALAAVR
ncbi:MAG: hypothetical protein ACREMQ_16860 [Longimicrobiales bacterium]